MLSLEQIKGIGPSSIKLLNKIGIKSVEDLINNIPRKYDDFSNVLNISKIRPGSVTIKARIHSVTKRYSRKGLHMTEALASDDSGSVKLMWFNQPYRASSLKKDEDYYISGEFAPSYKYLSIQNPSVELVSSFPINTARIVPQYKLTKGLSSNNIRKFTKLAFDKTKINETLPNWLIEEYSLISRDKALFHMHFPSTFKDMDEAKKRIGFEEVFELSLASELNKREFSKNNGLKIPISEKEIVDFVSKLPYKLTDDQRKATWQILLDMSSGVPMNRLLEGDVGSGKTIVALISAINALNSGYQTAIMAPTEILASQHFNTIKNLLPNNLKDKVILLSGQLKLNDKKKAQAEIENGKSLIIIGTHALIQDKIKFKNLGYVVIDEQHRFGVEQRKLLQSKADVMPHVLNMSATPIPRSIALTLYGELEITILAEKPAGRQTVHTEVINSEQRLNLYKSLNSKLVNGEQAFVVCPLITDDVTTGRSLSVENISIQVKQWLPKHKIAVIHGKMKSEEKEKIMRDFKNGAIKILVSTTVIEVGVDIPNATTMIIEGADKFGLAQLHQLRGRIGRGDKPGACYLIPTDSDGFSRRLKYIEKIYDGFKLADYDLEMRGPGAIYGTVQHGALDLRVAKLTDTKLIALARKAAKQYILKNENLLQYPELKARVDRLRTITNLN